MIILLTFITDDEGLLMMSEHVYMRAHVCVCVRAHVFVHKFMSEGLTDTENKLTAVRWERFWGDGRKVRGLRGINWKLQIVVGCKLQHRELSNTVISTQGVGVY